MPLIIDGYNLLHASGILPRGLGPGGLQRARLALLNFLVESLAPEELARAAIVFDAVGAPPGLPRELVHRGLKVYFAPESEGADQRIEELIRAESAPQTLVVVSSDHRLHRAARRRRATAVDSDQWHQQLVARRYARGAPPLEDAAKPIGPLGPHDVAYWLERFADVPNDDNAARAPGDVERTSSRPAAPHPFPPEYLRELERLLED
jgi:hypothetical protein